MRHPTSGRTSSRAVHTARGTADSAPNSSVNATKRPHGSYGTSGSKRA
jgi:hypothetical protein